MLVRLPRPAPHALFVRLDIALVVADMLWRRRCQRACDGGSYARWREAVPLLLIANHALLGSGNIARAWLDQVRGQRALAAGAWEGAEELSCSAVGAWLRLERRLQGQLSTAMLQAGECIPADGCTPPSCPLAGQRGAGGPPRRQPGAPRGPAAVRQPLHDHRHPVVQPQAHRVSRQPMQRMRREACRPACRR